MTGKCVRPIFFVSGDIRVTHFLFLFKNLFIYLFTWLHQVLVAACGLFVAACGLLSSCGTQAPEHVGSVVAACGLSCPTACGILVPQPGIEPASRALEGGFLTTGPPGKSLLFIS